MTPDPITAFHTLVNQFVAAGMPRPAAIQLIKDAIATEERDSLRRTCAICIRDAVINIEGQWWCSAHLASGPVARRAELWRASPAGAQS